MCMSTQNGICALSLIEEAMCRMYHRNRPPPPPAAAAAANNRQGKKQPPRKKNHGLNQNGIKFNVRVKYRGPEQGGLICRRLIFDCPPKKITTIFQKRCKGVNATPTWTIAAIHCPKTLKTTSNINWIRILGTKRWRGIWTLAIMELRVVQDGPNFPQLLGSKVKNGTHCWVLLIDRMHDTYMT